MLLLKLSCPCAASHHRRQGHSHTYSSHLLPVTGFRKSDLRASTIHVSWQKHGFAVNPERRPIHSSHISLIFKHFRCGRLQKISDVLSSSLSPRARRKAALWLRYISITLHYWSPALLTIQQTAEHYYYNLDVSRRAPRSSLWFCYIEKMIKSLLFNIFSIWISCLSNGSNNPRLPSGNSKSEVWWSAPGASLVLLEVTWAMDLITNTNTRLVHFNAKTASVKKKSQSGTFHFQEKNKKKKVIFFQRVCVFSAFSPETFHK